MVVRGKVIKGSGDGRRFGFPTINVELTSEPDLEYGVYASLIEIEGTRYSGVMHWGPRYIFNETKPKFEVFLFDFDKMIYGHEVDVKVIKKIRESIKFESEEDLVHQIELDVKEAKKILDYK